MRADRRRFWLNGLGFFLQENVAFFYADIQQHRIRYCACSRIQKQLKNTIHVAIVKFANCNQIQILVVDR